VVEVLKQPQYRPVSVEQQVIAIWVATGGYLDDHPVRDASRFVEEFGGYVESRAGEALAAIRDTGDMSDETEAALEAAVAAFRETFVPSGSDVGAEAGAGEGSAPDELRKDVGWDRMSSEEEDRHRRHRAKRCGRRTRRRRGRPARPTPRSRGSGWALSSASSAAGSARSSPR
jgi:hypothetical protein